MIQSLFARFIERIHTIQDLVKRLDNDPFLRLGCGFWVSDYVPSESSYSRMIQLISESEVLDFMQDSLIQTAISEGFLADNQIAIDATHFESREAAKPSEKKEAVPPKKRGRKSKVERESWLAEQAEKEANQTTYQKEMLRTTRHIRVATTLKSSSTVPKHCYSSQSRQSSAYRNSSNLSMV